MRESEIQGATPSAEEIGLKHIPWPKTARLMREIVVTEKLDGTNAALHITEEGAIYAQSRKRLITPGKQTDNYGFAQWAADNAGTLVDDLGPGLHFGEWWGKGINRAYDLDERRFSLFNTTKWGQEAQHFHTPGLGVVPTLYVGVMSTPIINARLRSLDLHGSYAAPGFMRPEGVCVFHVASGIVFKVLIEHDEIAKSLIQELGLVA